MPDDFMTIPLTDSSAQGSSEPDEFTVGATQPRATLPAVRNCAEDKACAQWIADELVGIVQYVRINRQILEEEWRSIRRMEHLRFDTGRKYFGRSDAYLPTWARTQSTLVSALSRGLFPSDDYMDVADRGTGDPERGKTVKAYLQWEFETIGRIRTKMKPFLRQLVNYGLAVKKAWYKQEIKSQGRTRRVSDVASVERAEPTWAQMKRYDGLATSTRSVFYTYFYPITADTLDEVTVLFEDIDVPLSYVKDMIRKKVWLNGEAALSVAPPYSHNYTQSEQLTEQLGLSTPQTTPFGGKELGDVRVLTEVWCYMPLPRDQYMPDEDPNEPIPARVVLAGDVPVWISRNPFFHQRPPYLVSRLNTHPGVFYGYGFGRLGRSLQYLTNDFANQTNDVGIYGLNPIAMINPGMMAGPNTPLAPGASWYVDDVDQAVKFISPKVELVEHGLMMLNTFMGMLQDQLGAPPQIQGFGGGKGAKTATQAQIQQRNALAPLQDIVEDIELETMVPLMEMTWINAQQFREDDVFVSVAGQSLRVSPADLAIDPVFRWMASSQAQNNQVRTQAALQYLQALMPFIPVLNQLGYVVDPTPLFSRTFSDGLGFRGFSDIIRPAQAAPGAMPMGGPGLGGPLPPNVVPISRGQLPGVQAEQGSRVRSALEQIGSQLDAVPGEGEEFMQTRNEADQISAQMGRTYGGQS